MANMVRNRDSDFASSTAILHHRRANMTLDKELLSLGEDMRFVYGTYNPIKIFTAPNPHTKGLSGAK